MIIYHKIPHLSPSSPSEDPPWARLANALPLASTLVSEFTPHMPIYTNGPNQTPSSFERWPQQPQLAALLSIALTREDWGRIRRRWSTATLADRSFWGATPSRGRRRCPRRQPSASERSRREPPSSPAPAVKGVAAETTPAASPCWAVGSRTTEPRKVPLRGRGGHSFCPFSTVCCLAWWGSTSLMAIQSSMRCRVVSFFLVTSFAFYLLWSYKVNMLCIYRCS